MAKSTKLNPRGSMKQIPQEAIKLINDTPFLQSLLYDLDLLPEQFKALEGNSRYALMYERLMGVILCYMAMTNGKRKRYD